MKIPTSHPLSAEHIAEFDAYINKWQKILRLEDWNIYRSPKKAARSNAADVEADIGAHRAKIRLGDWGVFPPTSESIEETALHELLHVLLRPVTHVYATSEDFTDQMAAEHRVIHTLTRLLLRGLD